MDWKRLAERLRSACSREVAKGEGWAAYAPAGDALDLRAMMVELATPDDIDDWTPHHGDLREEDANPAGTAGAVHDEWESSEVLVWEWVGRNSSWHASIGLFDAGDGRQYVTRFMEDAPYLVLGAIVPKAGPESFAAFFRDLMNDNGNAYGIDVLGSLPATTELHRPDLLTREVITDVYHDWMDDAEESGHSSWEALEQQLDDMDNEDDDDFDDSLGDADDEEEDEDESEEEEHDRLIADYCESTVLLFDEEEDDA